MSETNPPETPDEADEGNVAFELVAAEGMTWSYTPIRDWIMLIPELRGAPFQLYCLLRSLLFEKSSTRVLRKLTLDELCFLFPGVNGKPTSESTMKALLKTLAEWRLVTDRGREVKSGGRGQIDVSRRLQIHDLPELPYAGWTNAWQKLQDYRKDWKDREVRPPQWVAPKPPVLAETTCTCGSECAAHPAGQPPHGTEQPADKFPTNAPSDLDAAPQPPGERPREEPRADAARPASDNGVLNIDDRAQQVVLAWIGARDEQDVPKLGPDRIRRQAVELLASGMNVEYLCQAVAAMGSRGWTDIGKHLEHWSPPSVPTQRGAPGPARKAADCAWCNPNGWYETTDMALKQCRHPEEAPQDHPAAQKLAPGRTE